MTIPHPDEGIALLLDILEQLERGVRGTAQHTVFARPDGQRSSRNLYPGPSLPCGDRPAQYWIYD